MEHWVLDSLSSSRSLLMALGCTDIVARAALCVSPCPFLLVHVSLRINISTVSRRVSAEDTRDTGVPRNPCPYLLHFVDQSSWTSGAALMMTSLNPIHSKCRHASKLVSSLCRMAQRVRQPRWHAKSAATGSQHRLNIAGRWTSCARVVDVFGPRVNVDGSQGTRVGKG